MILDRARSVPLARSRASRLPSVLGPAVSGFLVAGASLLGSVVVLGVIWALAAQVAGKDLPGPVTTMETFWALASDPWRNAGPNDKGIGLLLFSSLQRVLTGFALGTIVAVPLGVLIGVSVSARRILDPIVQILRPVSPLAWFPLGLAAFHNAPSAIVFMIFITSLWATVINTAFGVSSIPESYKNVARVFRFSPVKYLARIVLPYSLPHILTGLRLSMGVAWLVIVAGEMLSGSTGIGFFVWDSWNALSVVNVTSAILFIGLVGLVLDRFFLWLVVRVSYGDVI